MMEFKIALEWDSQVGLSYNQVYPLREGIENAFNNKYYGDSISQIWVVLTAMGYDLKQRKRFKKDIKRFEYDIIIDFFLIKNVSIEEKKSIICNQIIQITEQTFQKYKFESFDKESFLLDFKKIVGSISW